jgi:hypothetical protein
LQAIPPTLYFIVLSKALFIKMQKYFLNFFFGGAFSTDTFRLTISPENFAVALNKK